MPMNVVYKSLSSQSENYQALDEDGLNQVYKFLMYNGAQGMMLSHPFPVERLHYLT